MSELRDNYEHVLERIDGAVRRSGRAPGSVRLLAVTKRVPAERIRAVVMLGQQDIAENRVQEAEEKLPGLSDLDVRCHLIGHLQSNKARRALSLFASIQSVDSPQLALRLDGMLDRPFPVFVQVRSGEEATKSGVHEADLGELVETIHATRWLSLEGLMGIPPFHENPEHVRPYFARIRTLAERYRLAGLSMGMSHDFEIAIEEGATHIRVGTALFGERQ